MTPDELPADMEGRLAEFADWLRPGGTEPCAYTSARIGADLRALLKAYQEQRRVLARLSALTPGAANATTARDLHLTVKAIADTVLNQKGDER